jgi:hypothetical protein
MRVTTMQPISFCLFLSLAACGNDSKPSCVQGSESCECKADHSCEAGLECSSNSCVRPDDEDQDGFTGDGDSDDGDAATSEDDASAGDGDGDVTPCGDGECRAEYSPCVQESSGAATCKDVCEQVGAVCSPDGCDAPLVGWADIQQGDCEEKNLGSSDALFVGCEEAIPWDEPRANSVRCCCDSE